ncbi:MAG TPA: SufS family cysteine desulfurase [Patescibacteria group bacterium]
MDINKLKSQFPIFERQSSLHYLDNAATTLKPKAVIEAMVDYYSGYSANIHRGLYPMSEKATMKYEAAREKAAEFINAYDGGEIVFTSGTTSGINLAAAGWGENNIKKGDEILITIAEHHSNLVPWQNLAKKKGAILKYLPTKDFEIDLSKIKEAVNEKTKIAAITQVSNVTGVVNPVKEIIKRIKEINPETVVLVDGAQAIAHMKVDVRDLWCDFYAFSGHKMYGPTGVGVLWIKKEQMERMEAVNFGGGMIEDVREFDFDTKMGPEKFEGGTPPIGEVVGLGSAIEFIEELGYSEISEQENRTLEYLLSELQKLPYVKILGPKDMKNRIGVVAFAIDEAGSHDMADIQSKENNVAIRAGFHCAIPLHVSNNFDYGTARASLAVYNTKDDVDALIKGIIYTKELFSKIK